MAFDGIIAAPRLQVAPCGLLSVARVVPTAQNSEAERWLRGFTSETNANPTVRILTINNDTVTDGEIFDGSGVDRHYPVYPFIIEVEAKRTGLALVEENPFDGSLQEQMAAASQKAAEFELWEGNAARALPTPGTGFLRQTGGATIVTSGAVDSERALELIEQSIATSPTGARGTIHLTRDVASDLGSRLIYKAKSRDDKKAYAVTRLGTLVVIGSGYTGNGPIGTTGAAATATNKWMYATGGVEVILGASVIVNESISQGFDPTINDSIIVAQRPAAVHFDPSIWSAAQVSL